MDEYGLDYREMRIYVHLVRRGNGKGWANPGITSMSKLCGMKRNTVVRVIRSLEARCIIHVIRTTGETNQYILRPYSEWRKLDETSIPLDTGIPTDTSIPRDTGVVSRTALPPVSLGILKGNPSEGNPLKDNTAEGRSPERREGAGLHPPVSRQNAGGNSAKIPFKPSQSPVQRKAYAVAERLRFRHWDNCKVSFSKHTARAYAETALQDGHDEHLILKNYDTALRYCHGVTTDEIGRGERLQHERASPALTVWLAREGLKGDPQSADERWQAIIARLKTEQQKASEEEARIRQEIETKAPAIKAWFTRDTTNGEPPMPEMEPQRITA